jgi:hypothetical protein
MLQYAMPPGYQRQQPIKRPKLGPWLGVIDAILDDDKQRPAKQRHTAKRILERLREEHGFSGGYTIVKDYVRSAELHSREMFIPLTHAPGEAQADSQTPGRKDALSHSGRIEGGSRNRSRLDARADDLCSLHRSPARRNALAPVDGR